MRVGIISLGNLKPKYTRHSFTMSLLDVQNNFIIMNSENKERFNACLVLLFSAVYNIQLYLE